MAERANDCPILAKEIIVEAPLERVWHAWTTPSGLTFVSAESEVELRPGGPYEWFLDLPPDEAGRRGSEGSRVLAFVPQKMLAFTWTFPPDTPTLRAAGETTTVIVVFDEIAPDVVQVILQAVGWQDGEEWRRGRAYFDVAWERVLARLKETLEASPRG